MSDIWSVGDSEGGSVGVADGSEDWGCSSGSEAEEQPPRKRAKRGDGFKQQQQRVIPTFDSSPPPADEDEDDDDDLLAGCLTTTPPTQQRSKKQSKQRSTPPLLLDDDDDLDWGAPTATATAAAAAKGKRTSGASPDPVQLAVVKQRALREKLAQAQHAGDEDDNDGIELLDSDEDDAVPSPAAGGEGLADDLLLLEELEPGPADAGEAPAAAAAGDDGKLPLVFQAQAQDSITVRVHRDQPLRQAMETFTNYAASNGWGRVSKFMFDGERLTGDDTPDDLQMDADDVVDVYLDS